MESAVHASELDWVITRPPVLTDKPAIGDFRAFSSDSREQAHSVTRADLAAFIVAQLTSDAHLRQASPSPTVEPDVLLAVLISRRWSRRVVW